MNDDTLSEESQNHKTKKKRKMIAQVIKIHLKSSNERMLMFGNKVFNLYSDDRRAWVAVSII